MKKLLICIVAAFAALSVIPGCAPSGSVTSGSESSEAANHASEYDNASFAGEADALSDKNAAAGGNGGSEFDPQKAIRGVKAKTYDFKNAYSQVLAMVIGNNSDYDCELNVSVEFYDDDDELVDTEEASVDVFSAGTENALIFYSKSEFAVYKYKLKVKEKSEYYGSVNQNLSCEVSEHTDEAIISATNNGTTTASYVEATALFFKDDELVGAGSSYVVDDEFEIKPGRTEKCTISCFENFDSVQVYLNGREIAY